MVQLWALQQEPKGVSSTDQKPLHVHLGSVWVLTRYSDFLLQSKDMCMNRIWNSILSVCGSVSVNVFMWPYDKLVMDEFLVHCLPSPTQVRRLMHFPNGLVPLTKCTERKQTHAEST